MHRSIRAALVLLAFAAAAIGATPSHAAFHIMKVREVYPGSPDAPQAQFIELQMWANGQNQVQGHGVQVYNAAGTQVGSYSFAAAVPNGATQSSILIATAQAQSAFGVSADLVMTPVIPSGGGKVCFDTIDCVTWGSYSGAGPNGTPFNAGEGLRAGASADRDVSGGTQPGFLDGDDDTGDSAADFLMTGPTPRNNAGQTGAASRSIGFSTSVYPSPESGTVTVTVQRSSSTGTDTVDYATADGTATAGDDYVATSGQLSFANGVASATFDVSILTDTEDEIDETVVLDLRSPSSGVLSIPRAVIEIEGNVESPEAPSAPQNFSATTGSGNGEIDLDWSAPADDGGVSITAYRIYGGPNPSSMTLVATVDDQVTSYTDNGTAPGQKRTFAVSAVNGVGEGPRTAALEATAGGAADTSNPTLTITTGTGTVIVNGLPHISGTASDNVAVARVDVLALDVLNRGIRGYTATCSPSCPSGNVDWSAPITGLAPGHYKLWIRAYDTSGRSSNCVAQTGSTTICASGWYEIHVVVVT